MKLDRMIAVRNKKIVYRDGNHCLKVFNKDYSKADVLNEALNQARAEETGLNIPEILDVTVLQGKWTIVSEFINGKTLSQLMLENPDKKDSYLQLFVNLQLEIHQKSCPDLIKLKDKMNRKISHTNLSATERYDLHTRLNGMPKHYKLCHGDFNPSNIIISDNNVPFILDWSHTAQGNASADAVRTYMLFCMNHDIECAKRYLELFCEKSNTDKQYVQKWIPIVAASQSINSNANERQFLHSLIDVAD